MTTKTLPARDASTSTEIVTFWRGADGQGDYDMTGMTASAALAELLGQCGEDAQREAILAGHFILA